MQLTADILRRIAPAAPKDVDKFVKPLIATMERYEINTLQRAAMFLAQLAHESDSFKAVEEYASGKAYEGRKDLGNVFPGDGVKYKGKSLIQLTGRANYKIVSKAFGIDFVAYPEKLKEPYWAAMIGGWFWDSKKLNTYADLPSTWRSKRKEDAFTTVSRLINGGLNGLADRKAKYARAIVALSPIFA